MPRDFAPEISVAAPAPFPSLTPRARAAMLGRVYAGLSAQETLREAIEVGFPCGGAALVSSFGAESAVLLHMVAEIDPWTPVLFLETQMLFPETLAYQQRLAALLGLRDVRLIRPEPAETAALDPDGRLHDSAPESCCALRKVRPLEAALAPFAAWITGRKRGQSSARATLTPVEADAAGRIKLNPLWDWSGKNLSDYLDHHALPRHPLVAKGYPSIGCAPCTTTVAPGEDPRAGRWRDSDKSECGIHLVNGRVTRRPADAGPMDGMGA